MSHFSGIQRGSPAFDEAPKGDVPPKTQEQTSASRGRHYTSGSDPSPIDSKVETARNQSLPPKNPQTSPAGKGGLTTGMYEGLAREYRNFLPLRERDFMESKYDSKQCIYSVHIQSLEAIRALVEKEGIEKVVESVNKSKFLQLVAEIGNLEVVRYLVDELKCDPNVFYEKQSPLIAAARNGHTATVEFLISRSSPNSFRDQTSHMAGVISYAAASWRSSEETIKFLVDQRNNYPVPIAGCLPAATHLVRTNREAVISFLSEELHISVAEGISDAKLIAQVVGVANSKESKALMTAVMQNNALLVDILVAAGAQPDEKDPLGKPLLELTDHPLIAQRLQEGLERVNSFRGRQLQHLLKDVHSSTMSPEDEIFSWSTLIRTLESGPELAPELQELCNTMKKSLGFRAVVESPLFSQSEKIEFIQSELSSMKEGECVILNDRNGLGHHTITLVEKQADGEWLCLQGDRYKMGSKGRQYADERFKTPSFEEVQSVCLGNRSILSPLFYRGPGKHPSHKIDKKWQGAENNCVTQSDTVAFDYILGERLGKSKAALYRQLKPLRIAYLSSALKEQGLPNSESQVLQWMKSRRHARFRELCPLIIPKDAYANSSPQELLEKLDCFITANDDGTLSLWKSTKKDGPTATVPWGEWQSLTAGIPRESTDPARRLYLERIARLTGPGTHLSFSLNDQNEGNFTCDLFSPPVQLHCQVMPTGVFAFRGPDGKYSIILHKFSALWRELPTLLVNQAKASGECMPNVEMVRGWINDAVSFAFKQSFRNAYHRSSEDTPPNESWTRFADMIEEQILQEWREGNVGLIRNLLGHEATSLAVDYDYRDEVADKLQNAIRQLSSWAKPVQEVKKVKRKYHLPSRKYTVETLGIEPPQDWASKMWLSGPKPKQR